MLQIDHRESHDIDLFIDDPQILPFLNPTTQGYGLTRNPDEYDTDGTSVTKLYFEDIGEIDFICCAEITDMPHQPHSVRERDVALETPGEIIAKKVFYRGSRLQPRDIFDIAAVNNHFGEGYVLEALRQCGRSRCLDALNVTHRMDRDFATRVIGQLMLREATRPLVETAQATVAALLEAAAG